MKQFNFVRIHYLRTRATTACYSISEGDSMISTAIKLAARVAGQPWTIDDAARHLGISDRHLRHLIDEERVRSIRLGRRVFIPDAELQRVANEGTGE